MIKLKSESAEYPVLLDKTSSRTTVYHRFNVVEKEREEGQRYYSYDEYQYTKSEWREVEIDTQLFNQDLRLTMIELGV